MKKIAIFTAAIDGDNSGDAIIESAITRLLADVEIQRFPLVGVITPAMIEEINRCEAAVICGTNLYQEVFACALTLEVVNQIRVPIIPFGIGASAAMGGIPKMNAAGVAAVRAIHKSCVLGGVRDEASLRFLHSIGVRNAVLTGCPVLFHGLALPDFRPSGEGVTLTPSARLLHIDPRWEARQTETLDLLAARYRPDLVLQSPYDLEESEPLARKYGLKLVYDPAWQAPLYIEAAKAQSMNLGFRLHFAMLSIAYGKPAFLVSHDSRADEFCKLLDLPRLRIDRYADAFLTLKADSRDFPADGVRRRWDQLATEMRAFMSANGLTTRLEAEPTRKVLGKPWKPVRKPRIGILVDVPGWAYDISMVQVREALKDQFDIDIQYVSEKPKLDPAQYDLLHVCFWGEDYHRAFGFKPERVIKEVSSHRWEFDAPYGPISPSAMGEKYLSDCRTLICTSRRLQELMSGLGKVVYHTPNGTDAARFARRTPRQGPLTFGWAGNASDPLKGFYDIVEPACAGRTLIAAKGEIRHELMPGFYRKTDVYVVASRHEGEPLTLVEAMAAGCFPVTTDVGIAPELIRHRDNGYIVADRSVAGFKEAFDWCEANAEAVRAAGRANAELIARERNWGVCSQFFARAYWETLMRLGPPLCRNDDVSWDSDLASLRRFSETFHRHGHTQVHGVTLNGSTNAAFRHGSVAAEYEGQDTISKLPNADIRRLSTGQPIAERADLIAWLNETPDELALHGLYHTDYSQKDYDEQVSDLAEGLAQMRELFPNKPVRYFIAPFNRTNIHTHAAARALGLEVLSDDGVHLEAELEALELQPGVWHRYHHHRFYPESRFDFWSLSIDKLDAALAAAAERQPPDLGLHTPDQEVELPQRPKVSVADRLRSVKHTVQRRLRR